MRWGRIIVVEHQVVLAAISDHHRPRGLETLGAAERNRFIQLGEFCGDERLQLSQQGFLCRIAGHVLQYRSAPLASLESKPERPLRMLDAIREVRTPVE